MQKFAVGWCLAILFTTVLNLMLDDKKTESSKKIVYSASCEHRCGKDKYELVNYNNLCVCSNGKTYKRDLSKLYK